MGEIKWEARDYLNYQQSAGHILRLARWGADPNGNENCVGRGKALILNSDDRVAVMLEDCGDPEVSGVHAGDLVNYDDHPELGELRIVGSPATVRLE